MRFRPDVEPLEDRLVPATFTVHNAAQLAAAITAADAAPGSTINLAPGTSASYLLTSSLPAITANMTLQGTGTKATQVVVDGQNASGSDFTITRDFLTVTFKNMEITGGNATYGGGIVADIDNLNLSNVLVTENNATNAGGGIFQEGGSLTMNGCQITNNTAGTFGGGYANLGAYGGKGTPSNFIPYNTVVSISNSSVSGNTALIGDGGGVYAHNDDGTLTISNSHIDGNSTGAYGGGIYTNAFAVKITGSTVNNNASGAEGGGIGFFSDTSATLNLTSSQVSGNVAAGNGGGIYMSANKLTLVNSSVNGNTSAGGYGGGVYDVGSLSMTSSHIDNNTAQYGGGGVFDFNGTAPATIVVNSSTINGNTSHFGYGGGFEWVYAHGTMTLNSSSISNNHALSGGGIAIHGDADFPVSATLTLNGSQVNDNAASGTPIIPQIKPQLNIGAAGYGGGIDVVTGNTGALITVTLNSNSTVDGNQAYGGGGIEAFAKNGGTVNLTVNQSAVSNNIAKAFGGGIHELNSAAGGGSDFLTLNQATIANNVAGVQGGGVRYVQRAAGTGKVTITNSTVSSNRAAGEGGGLLIFGGLPTLTMTGSTINNNSAGGSAGGGMFLGLSTGASSFLVNDTITNNIARGSGGGINVSNGNLNLVNLTIASNQIIGGTGGGINVALGTVNIGNSIIALNTRRANATSAPVYNDAAGTFHFFTTGPFAVTGGGPNLVTSLASAPDFASDPILFTGNPQLGPLANNGGPTQTRAITANSPAAFVGSVPLDEAFVLFGALNDQRGIPRMPPHAGKVDLGAYD
jgi:hypothetical protein